MSQPYNVLYINTHDTGRYIQPYGFAVPTPNLQRLAETGVTLRNCHCGGPTCSPSRATLVTGRYPHCNGMLGLAHRGFQLNNYQHHIAWHLRKEGWHCAAAGDGGTNHCANSHPDKGAANGYEEIIPGDPTEVAMEFIARDHAKPFFLSVSYGLTHRMDAGFHTPPSADIDGRWQRAPACLPDTPEIRADWAHFLADAREMDRQWGLIFQALEDAGIADNTLIIATTDHGAPFPYMKCSLTAQGTGVFCILRGPGFNERSGAGGVVVDALTSQVDLYPTICDVLEIPKPDHLQGLSLIGTPQQPTAEIHDFIISEVTWHAAYEPKRAYRTPRHVLIEQFEDRLRPVMPNCDHSPSKEVCVSGGWQPVADLALYDSWCDSHEIANRMHDPAYAHVAQRLRSQLHAWMAETDDPILYRQPVRPPNTVVTPSDDLNPAGDGPRWSKNDA